MPEEEEEEQNGAEDVIDEEDVELEVDSHLDTFNSD